MSQELRLTMPFRSMIISHDCEITHHAEAWSVLWHDHHRMPFPWILILRIAACHEDVEPELIVPFAIAVELAAIDDEPTGVVRIFLDTTRDLCCIRGSNVWLGHGIR